MLVDFGDPKNYLATLKRVATPSLRNAEIGYLKKRIMQTKGQKSGQKGFDILIFKVGVPRIYLRAFWFLQALKDGKTLI
jgi:hypothetical protein